MMVFLLILTFLFFVLSLYFRSQVILLTVAQDAVKKGDAGSVSGIKKDVKSGNINARTATTHGAVAVGNRATGGLLGGGLRVANRANRVTGGGVSKSQQFHLNTMKKARRFADMGFVTMLVIDVIYLVFIFIIIFVLIIPALVTGVGLFGESSGGGTRSSSSSSTNQGTADEDKPSDTGGGDTWIEGDTSAPPGADQADWDSADEMGKIIARTAYNAAIMDFPKAGDPANASPSGGLSYDQGNTPIGVYDCSTFVSAVLEANGILSNGSGKRQGDKYDFQTMKKSDLQNYEYTGAEIASWSALASPVVRVGEAGWEDKVKAGDLVVNANHAAIFIGKNSGGEPVIANAASWSAGYSGSVIYKDYDRKVPTYEVGLNVGSEILYMFPGNTGMVFRPSQMYGNL